MDAERKQYQADYKRKWWAQQPRATHCPRGHEFTPENTVKSHGNGVRRCRICLNAKKRRSHYRTKYGLTIEQRDQMLKEQGGCKLCGTPEPKGFGTKDGNGWHVDHIHGTNIVRGILCARCNLLLGMLNDDVQFLDSIKAYIQRFQ